MKELHYTAAIRYFENGSDALYYLMDTKEQPFLIISDINMPGMDGLELRRKINESFYLHRKSIPFIFLTTSTYSEHVIRAYDLMADGYFVKPDNFSELKVIVRHMLDYWTYCRHPNSLLPARN